jgi:hypothetical protein
MFIYAQRQNLFFAVLGSVMRLEIVDDFLCRIIRNRSPIRFYHLVHFVGPSIGRQRRLHSDIPGAVTRIAVGRNFLLAVVGSEHRRVERICRYVVGNETVVSRFLGPHVRKADFASK